MVIVFAIVALVCWWRGDHLPAVGSAFLAATLLWPPLPDHALGALAALAGTEAGGTVILYALTFAVPVLGVAALCGWRPSYRTYAQPRAARAAKSRMSGWVVREDPAQNTPGSA